MGEGDVPEFFGQDDLEKILERERGKRQGTNPSAELTNSPAMHSKLTRVERLEEFADKYPTTTTFLGIGASGLGGAAAGTALYGLLVLHAICKADSAQLTKIYENLPKILEGAGNFASVGATLGIIGAGLAVLDTIYLPAIESRIERWLKNKDYKEHV